MTARPQHDPLPDPAAAETAFTAEVREIRGATRELNAEIARLAAIEIHAAAGDAWLGFVCQSTRVAGGMSRLQRANARAARAMVRLRKIAK